MEKKIIISICREFCSGGAEIGKKLSEKLNIKFYDKKILKICAKESGYTESIFEQMDEKPTNSFLYSLVMGFNQHNFLNDDFLTNDKLFAIQADIIRDIAKKESCIIVGRCSDYILREEENLIRIYLRAEMDFKLKRFLEKNPEIDKKVAETQINKANIQRKNYYNYYTGKEWDKLDNYDLIINTSKLGIDGSVNQILNYIENLGLN